MFISHLNCFIFFISFLLFVLRFKKHSFSENLLFLFSFLAFISSSLWLYINYYNPKINLFVDYFGIIIENLLLPLSLFYIYFLDKTPKKHIKYGVIFVLIAFSLLSFYVHLFLSDRRDYIFFPTNTNATNNLIFQIIIDAVLFVLFILFFYKKKSFKDGELFDGSFKKYSFLAFCFYFLQDILILTLLYLTLKNIIISDVIIDLTLVFNLITSLFLVMIAIYTNWLKEYNSIRTESKKPPVKEAFTISINDLRKVKLTDWNSIKDNFKTTYPELINSIESNKDLSKTEKLYAFLDHFQFSNKDLSEILCVSIRTIETNFYRMRRKIKDNDQ